MTTGGLPGALPAEPRQLAPEHMLHVIATWIGTVLDREGAVGLVVPMSGTDSIATFLCCAHAISQRPHGDVALTGIHYGKAYPWKEPLLTICRDRGYSRVSMETYDLTSRSDRLQSVSDPLFIHDEYLRWAHVQSYALGRTFQNAGDPEPHLVVGTRNRTERLLFKYSIASNVAVMEPIAELYKSEVLRLCAALGVPQAILMQSRCSDLQCGRPGVMAENIEALDRLLLVREGRLHPQNAESIPLPLRTALNTFLDQTLAARGFMGRIPYLPDEGMFG